MIPRIIEYNIENSKVTITENCYLIPELKAIIDNYDSPEVYMAYCYLMSAPDSPYINVPIDEKSEVIIFDVIQLFGEFEHTSPLLQLAIDKLKSLYTSVTVRHYEGLQILIDKFTKYMIVNEISEGKDGNMTELQRIVKDAGLNIKSYKELERQVEEELKAKTRGGHEVGEY